MKHLLIIAQKIDANDDHRGFFIDWLNEFSKRFERVSVITVAEGTHRLPPNVHVYSLGKERGASKLLQAARFYRKLIQLMPSVDGVFAHSSPIFAVAAWPISGFFDKKMVFWYLHRADTLKLRLALRLSDTLVTADAASLTIKSPKIISLGHGIDTKRFEARRDWGQLGVRSLHLASVGRLTPIKDYATLIRAVGSLRNKGTDAVLKIVGRAVMPNDVRYQRQMEDIVRELRLEDRVEFAGFTRYDDMPALYAWADMAIGGTPHGGIDKAILEGMAAGCLTLTSNGANRPYFGPYADRLIFPHGDDAALAEKIETIGRLPVTELSAMSEFLVASVAKHHGLQNLIGKISSLYE